MERDELAYQASVLHYVQGETMDAIARHLMVSRSTVSRLIQRARELGYVHITVTAPTDTPSSLAREIADCFGVQPHIVPVPRASDPIRSLNAVATTAAIIISELVDDTQIIGVAWGNTLSAVGAQLIPKAAPGSFVVQLNGAANPRSIRGVNYAGSIMDAFVAAYGSTPVYFPVPAFFDDADTRQALWRERSVHQVRRMQERCTLAVFGVGAIGASMLSHVYADGYLSDDELAALAADGVVGDICTVLLRRDGTWADLEINRRASGPSPDELRRIPRRFCVVSDVGKVVSTLGALRAGVATDLVIDEQSAKALLRLVDDGWGAGRASNNAP